VLLSLSQEGLGQEDRLFQLHHCRLRRELESLGLTGCAALVGRVTRPGTNFCFYALERWDTLLFHCRPPLRRLYNATMTHVAVGNITLDLPPAAFYNASNDRPDAIFDTGSDLIGLPGILYNAVFEAVRKLCRKPGNEHNRSVQRCSTLRLRLLS
jgi:hypothetical protein